MIVSRSKNLERFWSEARTVLDEALAQAVPAADATPGALHDAMRYTLLSPGKRVRGALVLASCELFRGSREEALPLACAVEMVHAASLILDDLPSMDDATLRRGKPALHRVGGEANAILASVALLNAAFGALAQAGSRARVRQRAAACLVRAIGADGLIGGQVVDLEATGRRLDLAALEFVHSHKTGALFIAAAELGALAGGAHARDVEALRAYAKNLGLAFQITDDLLDYSGDPATTGKDAGMDREKTTFVDLCGIDGSRRLVDELIESALDALSGFRARADVLRALAEYVRGRDR
jgi:geranylgeranyl diphosphate synthase type II